MCRSSPEGARRYSARRHRSARRAAFAAQPAMSTQQGFGLFMHEIAKSDASFAERIVTTSPDVTVSTNLGAWVNRRGLFAREEMADSVQDGAHPFDLQLDVLAKGQHLELGIAEMNLFIMLSALGLSHSIFGERLLPVGTLYDPFIERGLDALNYACYQDARFILVATPSGVTLAPEGGAHQSIATPLIGMAQDGLASFEPALSMSSPPSCAGPSTTCSAPARRSPTRRPGCAIRSAARSISGFRRGRSNNRSAQIDPGAREGHRRWRLLDAAPGPECASCRRLYRCGRTRGYRGGRAHGGGSPRCRPARHHIGRPPERRLDGGSSRARERGLSHAPQPYRTAVGRMFRPTARWSRSLTAIRRRSPGSDRCRATAPGRSASSISARPAPLPISTVISASMLRQF